MTIAATLGPIVAGLDAAAIPYMLVGSFASSLHGEPRVTHDLDLVIDAGRDALVAFLAGIPERFYFDRDVALDAFARRSMFNLIDTETGWKVDLIVRKARPFSIEEMARRQPSVLDGVPVFVATAEDTVVAKLACAATRSIARTSSAGSSSSACRRSGRRPRVSCSPSRGDFRGTPSTGA